MEFFSLLKGKQKLLENLVFSIYLKVKLILGGNWSTVSKLTHLAKGFCVFIWYMSSHLVSIKGNCEGFPK